MRTLLIFAAIALGVSIFWYVPAANHHGDIVRVCKEKGYVNGAPFGADIKCEEMKVKK
ncbi:hypothetical protein TW1_053 [Pseudoalteromonas phage TW1]|uniref:hypothetical protein n=1 Tax=Pseudoalteromonas phage TW1 TaxID=1366055 RepID=UPI00035AB8AD|nr:hypothetical protein PP585_gp53 [Pseudoalteromonas phage TW1]AGR46569.1 hypothetical protein TW1_053 [Pseudoalteromonas phage TW1]